MFKKRILPIIIVAAIVAAAIFGGRFAWEHAGQKKEKIEVISVTNLNWGYWGDDMTSYGMVTNDSSQEIFLQEGEVISEVYVEEGQTVEKGDELIAYDTTSEALQVEIQELQIQKISNDIALEQRKIAKLRTIVPVAEEPVAPELPEIPEPMPQENDPAGGIEEKSGEAYQYIATTAVPYKGKGTQEKPFRFVCTKDAFVFGSYLNYLAEHDYCAVFEVHKNNLAEGKVIYSWEVNGASLTKDNDETAKWLIKTRQPVIEPEEDFENEPDYEEEEETELEDAGETYTAQELADAIAESERTITQLDFSKRRAELELEQMKEKVEQGVVTAKFDGVVSSLISEEKAKKNGTAFMQVTGSEGLYVRGSISELLLDDIKVGQEVTAMSWDSGNTFVATITEISKYPSTNNDYYGSGNPNVSYYDYTAYIEDTEGLKNGEYLDLTISTPGDEQGTGIYLEKAYVREEDGKSYVMKAKDGVLVKQYVETGKIVYGEAIEIKQGLTQEDKIAFPYGTNVKEGAAVKQVEGEEM